MYPKLFDISVFGTRMAIGSYTAFILLAFFFGSLVLWIALSRVGLPRRQAAFFVAITAFVFPLGARLMYLLTHPYLYQLGFIDNIAITPNRFSIYGGLILSVLAGVIMARLFQLSLHRVADSAVPALGVAIFLAKTGCLLNGCCRGLSTRVPWAITPAGRDVEVSGTAMLGGLGGLLRGTADTGPIHPIAAYEMIGVFLAIGIAFVLSRGRSPGTAFFTFAAVFTAVRFIVFFFRAGQSPFEQLFYPILYIALFIACVVFAKAATKTDGTENRRLFAGQTIQARSGGAESSVLSD